MSVIVVIDDEPVVLEFLARLLRMDGHDIRELSDPVAAYDVILSVRGAIDLVITDADLRPISGFELANRLRQNAVACPVLVISGHVGLTELYNKSLWPIASLEKPFTAAEFRAAVDYALTGLKDTPISSV